MILKPIHRCHLEFMLLFETPFMIRSSHSELRGDPLPYRGYIYVYDIFIYIFGRVK